ncbi:MAG: hypothetical protein JSV19_02920 [Phycisphaerales bacterium]|nr:MAG: hypothetical protein JSV19_02920 [Phycisphaerales bacterium]
MTRRRKALRLIIATLFGMGIGLVWFFFFLGWIRLGHALPDWVNVVIAVFGSAVLSLTFGLAAAKSLVRKAKDH